MSKSLESTLLFAIDQTTKLARQYAQKEFDRLGIDITVEQWVLLKVIEEKNLLSQTELAQESRRDPASITRTLDILQKKGLVLREAVLNNRRQYHVKLSKQGIDFVNRHMPLVNELRGISTKGFSKAELDTFLHMLQRVRDNMS